MTYTSDDLRHGLFPGMVLVLWGATAFGAVHGIADDVAMLMFNQNNWDTPPGPDGSPWPCW